SHHDLAHAAHLVDDLLTGAGATQEERQAIADHLTGRNHLALHGPSQDPWTLTTALAHAWHTYSRRADLPAPVLLTILDGECDMVSTYVDTETATQILQDDEDTPTPDQVTDLVHWLEKEDLWRDEVTATQVRAAWASYRARHPSAPSTSHRHKVDPVDPPTPLRPRPSRAPDKALPRSQTTQTLATGA
ncbi:hypothetical protein, partial [Actinomyces wuliandei]